MSRELEIIVKAADACNARCLYCSAGSASSGRRRLTVDTARRLCESARHLLNKGRFDRVRFLWHGGEPLLLGKEFFRQLRTFGRSIPLAHKIQTNLTLLDAEWIEILEPIIGRDGIGTSLDPFDDVRHLPGARYNESWLRGFDLCMSANWRVGVVYVLHRGALSRARDLYWFFMNLSDNSCLSLRLNPLLAKGRALDAACESLLLRPGEYGDFLIETTQIWLRDNRRLCVTPIVDLVNLFQGNRTKISCDLAGRAGCMAAHLGVDPDGNVYNCGRAADSSGPRFGNIREADLVDCLDHPSRQLLLEREDILLEGDCGSCPYWGFCHGGCPYDSYEGAKQVNAPTSLCADYRRFLSWLESAQIPVSPRGTELPEAITLAPPRQEPLFIAPASWSGAPEVKRLRMRAKTARDLRGSSQMLNANRGASIELPTSLLPAYREIAQDTSVLRIERLVLDQPPVAMDPFLKDVLAIKDLAVWIAHDVFGGAFDAIEWFTARRVPVALDRIRDWSAGDLRRLADYFLHSENLEVPIEPFYATFQFCMPDGPPFSLIRFYDELPGLQAYVTEAGDMAISRAHGDAGIYLDAVARHETPPRLRNYIGSPCSTCEAYKCCGGFWLDPIPLPDHCACWRGIVSLFMNIPANERTVV